MNLLWTKDLNMPSFPPLEGEVRTDVLVIGGGMAGVLCAHQLQQAGADCVLVEADRLGCGITEGTTAKLTSQHGLIYDRLIREFGTEKAGAYLRANEAALGEFRALCAGIDCDYETRDNYVYTLNSPQKIDRELAALQALGFPARRADSLPLPVAAAGAVCFPGQAQFHPLRFLAVVARGLRIYEHTAVRTLTGTTALTDRGRIAARRVIVATHFPFLNKHGLYFLKLYQHRSYVIGLENAPQVDGMYVDEAESGLSFRNYRGLLLLGGGGHRTGKQGGGWQALRAFAAQNYPQAVEKFHWATQDCMTLDGAPYIGRYSAGTENLYVATGFNKWGMSGSMTAAMLLTELLQGRESPWAAAFDPSRTLLRPQLAANGIEAAVSLLTPTAPRCPHLGCALKWNAAERSWDCGCHGSRFTGEGRLLDNPATGDLKRRPGDGG